MKKQILVGLTSILLTVFTACGGNSDQPPPPVALNGGPQNPADIQAQQALQNWIQQAVQICSQAACQFAQQNLPNLIPGYGGGMAGPGGPGMPGAEPPQAMGAMPVGFSPGGPGGFQPPPGINTAPTPSQGACQNAVHQVTANLSTMGNGTYQQRPDVQAYIQQAFFQPIGTQVAQCVPPMFSNPQFMQGLMQLGSAFSSTIGLGAGVPPGALSQIQNGFQTQMGSLAGGFPH